MTGRGQARRGAPVSAVVVAVALAVVASAHVVLDGGSTDVDADTPPDPDDGWHKLLDDAIVASRTTSFEGRMVMIAFGPDGPDVTEVEVAQGSDGRLQVAEAETWLVGRVDGQAFYRQLPGGPADAAGDVVGRTDGVRLRLGGAERHWFSPDALRPKYAVRVEGHRLLATGRTVVVAVVARDTGVCRERLYVHERTGLVVRRDTFAVDGAPARVVAFTQLDVTDQFPSSAALAATAGGAAATPDRDRLERAGWVVPPRLPAGYRLASGYVPRDSAGRSVHLVYSDGLYTVSLYEQVGRVDATALAGAVASVHDGHHVLRWPGSEPERMVWTGDDMTFTVVSDAPHDELMEVIGALPNDPPPSTAERIGRGLARLARWVWPLD